MSLIGFWLRFSGLLIPMSLTLLLAATIVGQNTEKRVIAFIQEDTFDTRYIYLMDIDKGLRQKLSDFEIRECCLVWSPNGEQLAFPNHKSRDTSKIYLIDADGRNAHLLNPNDTQIYEYWPAWSLDGERLAFVLAEKRSDFATNQLYTIDPHGKHLTRLSNGGRGYSAPSFSPDGKHIAFFSMEDADRFYIYVMDSDGNHITQLTDNGTEFGPVWSPDGQKILYQSRVDNQRTSIWVMNADGSSKKELTNEWNSDYSPTWTPDGQHILFVSIRYNTYGIFIMNADGSNQRQLTIRWHQDYPAWQP